MVARGTGLGVASLGSFWKVRHGAGQRGNSERKHCGVEPSLNHPGPELCVRWGQVGVRELTPHFPRPPAWGSLSTEHAGGLASGAGPASDRGEVMPAPRLRAPLFPSLEPGHSSGERSPEALKGGLFPVPPAPGSAPHRPRAPARSPASAWADPHCLSGASLLGLFTSCPPAPMWTNSPRTNRREQRGGWASRPKVQTLTSLASRQFICCSRMLVRPPQGMRTPKHVAFAGT